MHLELGFFARSLGTAALRYVGARPEDKKVGFLNNFALQPHAPLIYYSPVGLCACPSTTNRL